jgi:2-oxoisovalerate dehydrogenase E1 component
MPAKSPSTESAVKKSKKGAAASKRQAPAGRKDGSRANGKPAAAELMGYEGDLDVQAVGPADFQPEELKRVLRTMMMSRRLDEKMLTLLKQGKGFFHIGCAGHEAAQAGLGLHLRGGHDWFCMYYRDLTMSLMAGMTPRDTMLAHLAKADDPSSGGRQMSEHFGHRDLNIMTTSSSVGAQFMPGVGIRALRDAAWRGQRHVHLGR